MLKKSILGIVTAVIIASLVILLSSCGGSGIPKQMGVAGANTYGYSTATDASGNVYVAGYTEGGLDGNTLTGIVDFFLTKYNSHGTKVYTKQMGVAGASTYGQSVATDASGNVYVAGYTNGALDGNTLTGLNDFFLTKYDSRGTKVYTRQMGVAGASTKGASTATDASGNVYVAGYTSGGLDGNTISTNFDFFLTKYDSSGTKVFTRMGGANSTTSGMSTATDANGNVYVAGTTVGLDGNTLTGIEDFFLTKYDSAGTKVYTRQMGVAGLISYGDSVATDASGDVYVTGRSLDLASPPNRSGFLAKYDSSGTMVYFKQLVGAPYTLTFSRSVATDASSNVYVAGYTSDGLDGNTIPVNTLDFFLTKYDSSGTKLYTRQMGAAGTMTFGLSTATDATGNVYVTGYTNGGLGGNTLTGTQDFFLIKYDSTGTLR